MPGFDIGHLILLFGVALIVFGPERLQEIARTVAHTLAEFRQAAAGVPALLDAPTSNSLAGQGDAATGEGAMSLTEHFEELRSRLMYAAIPILVAAVACFFFSDPILRILKHPAGPGFQINAFGPMDGFVLKWKVALYGGLVISSPFWSYELLAFITPGLTPQERRFLFPLMVAMAVLFLAGSAFGYAMLSNMVRVMFSMFGREINYLPNANQYISFVLFFMLACGLVFELPVVLLALVRVGILKPDVLRRQRKIAYFLLFVFSEVVTPVSDPFVAPMIVMIPLVILYEGAIFASRFVVPRPSAEAAAATSK